MTRLAFLGSPGPAVAALKALVAADHEVALVVSKADTRRGRGAALMPSAVKSAAQGLGLPVSDRLDDVLDAGVDLAVVVAYGKIVPERVLDAVPMINVHFSLLPRWRGAAPVERAILAGDTVTGVCVMRLEAGLDTGPVLARWETPIGADEHAAALMERLSAAGAALLTDVLGAGGSLGPGVAQEGEPTYAAKLDPGEFRLDWQEPAETAYRVVRLDRAWTTFRGERLRILGARVLDADDPAGPGSAPVPGRLVDDGPAVVECGLGRLALLSVQPAGKRPMAADDWRRGVRPEPGELLGL